MSGRKVCHVQAISLAPSPVLPRLRNTVDSRVLGDGRASARGGEHLLPEHLPSPGMRMRTQQLWCLCRCTRNGCAAAGQPPSTHRQYLQSGSILPITWLRTGGPASLEHLALRIPAELFETTMQQEKETRFLRNPRKLIRMKGNGKRHWRRQIPQLCHNLHVHGLPSTPPTSQTGREF